MYTIPVNGGAEKRLTKGGFNDGPEYSPDGKYIWYNATNSGLMQVWRMERDGGEQTQITENRRNNWFPHVSPDGKRVVYISYGPEQLIILGHGALRLSASAFRQEVEQVEGQIADILAANNRRQKTGNVRSALERAQRQTEEEKP